MTQYSKLWVLKSDTDASPGDEIEVSLKSGKTKKVTIERNLGKFWFNAKPSYLLLPKDTRDQTT